MIDVVEADPLSWQEAAEDEQETAQVQAWPQHALERYYLYERDSEQTEVMEVQEGDFGMEGAAETFLLPDLAMTQPYPARCKSIGPMMWDLVDPEGKVVPKILALTSDRRRFLIGVADWEGDRTLQEHWDTLGGHARSEIMTAWTEMRQSLGRPDG